MTLDEVRAVTPARAVSDAEMDDALESCLAAIDEAQKRGRAQFVDGRLTFAPPWDAELKRLMATYAPYFATRLVRRVAA